MSIKNIDGTTYSTIKGGDVRWLNLTEISSSSVRAFFNNMELPCKIDDDILIFRMTVSRAKATPVYTFYGRLHFDNKRVTLTGSHSIATLIKRFNELLL